MMLSSVGTDCERFDSNDVSPGERTSWWEDVLSNICGPMDLAVAQRDSSPLFSARARVRRIADLKLLDADCGPCTGTRTDMHVARSDEDLVVVVLMMSGCEAVSLGDDSTLIRGGDAVLWDTHSAVRFEVIEPVRKRALLIPRSALFEVAGRTFHLGGMILQRQLPALRLLASYLDLLSETANSLSAGELFAARNAALELVNGATRPLFDGDTTGSGLALRAAVERWIDTHLRDEDLSLASVSAAHSVSARTVQRVFGMTGDTFNGTIRVKRLARARDELAHATDSITTIAHRWRFSDASHFSKLFKAQFGVSPSMYRAELYPRGHFQARPPA